jgi:hypothetical protein
MLEGKCPKCGYQVFGWALRSEQYQICPKCYIKLEILENGGRIFTGYSLFTREGYPIKPPNPNNVPTAHYRDEDGAGQKK